MIAMSVTVVRRERVAVTVAVLIVAAVAWLLVGWLSTGMDGDEERMLTMGMSAPFFLATWAAMMAAMMLPTASPMVDAFMRIQSGRRSAGNAYVPGTVFVLGYLLIWSSAGVIAFVAARVLEDLSMNRDWLMDNGARFGGVLILGAGLYQLSPLKRKCLGQCRTPMAFIVTSWRDGRLGAVRMGLHHGLLCLGCCWLLFAILFPLGIMNLAVMAAITVLVVVEKMLARGELAARLAAAGLLAYGTSVVLFPALLPEMM